MQRILKKVDNQFECVIAESLIEGEASFLMKCPSCGKRTISSQQVYIHDNIKREWYCRNCGQKLNNYNLLKKKEV